MKTNVKKFLGRENKYREEIKRVQKERKEKKKEAKKQKELEERKDGQDKPNENLSDEKWRSRARVKPLLDEQETTEDGKELNKAIVDGRKRFQAARSAAWKKCTLQKQRQLEITCYGLLMRFSCCIFFTVSCSSYSFFKRKINFASFGR